jgi:hypothetical protein
MVATEKRRSVVKLPQKRRFFFDCIERDGYDRFKAVGLAQSMRASKSRSVVCEECNDLTDVAGTFMRIPS